ncbi:hypothetical protein KKI90_01240 [Xenorhabdus bovienii]|uniref:Uncharacterized protein n=1 Tax=Xenorhabdus bovienii TaxID=40576 RepID=A0AAJ1J7R3_XENBV|nr:hypothetical protein [Xenorhabdus bovienii]MDE1476898.1 hypothetical protein [Xenorhabdus bovienii]MDE1485087.1 hypothetical protein [Xenorhabdus bovienii]MDE1494182.1 hypothetical protein [Xenorhabdus bovienii]MDE9430576.1 hypothetical protein [Xenorhabdus bovienii]MDE9444912.1 hypothetical protein [Xenorhabdus bovienii]
MTRRFSYHIATGLTGCSVLVLLPVYADEQPLIHQQQQAQEQRLAPRQPAR